MANQEIILSRSDKTIRLPMAVFGSTSILQRLSRIFGIVGDSVYLKDKYSDRVFFPNEEGKFFQSNEDSSAVIAGSELSVEGENVTTMSPTAVPSQTPVVQSAANGANRLVNACHIPKKYILVHTCMYVLFM